MTTAVSLDDLDPQSRDTCPRDRYGRYLIVPEGGKKAVPHTRVSTFKGAVEERYGLERWGKRVVAMGVAGDDELRAAIAATRPEEKQELDRFCEEAFKKGGGEKKSMLGTALHSFCERHDLGEVGLHIPQPWDADVKAYEEMKQKAGIRILEVEQILVLPEFTVAGMTDRIQDFGEGSQPFISDHKTGTDLSYSWLGISIQLSLYAHAESIYDPTTQKHRPMPKVRQDKAMVVHLPAGQARCDLYWVDIEAGWAMVPHCARVREWQKTKGLHTKWQPGSDDGLLERRNDLTKRIQALKDQLPQAAAALAQRWPDVPTFKACDSHTAEQLSVIDAVLCAVEAEYEAPF